MKYKPTIGLEIHVELKTKTKMFCDCLNETWKIGEQNLEPNKNVCPVCLAHPGTLPVINKEAVKMVLKAGLALNCKIREKSKFDRKQYFYPDLPKGYQISQYDQPLCENGYIEINNKKIKITRIHLEEDTGKLTHINDKSLVDYNRAGVPLMELVTEPDIESGAEAKEFCQELQRIFRELEIADAEMQKGQMRCEVNISVSDSDKLGTKVEIKNLNSFKAVEKSINYEIQRQSRLLEHDEKIIQETLGWDENKLETFAQRTKEGSADYRYFPEPDLPPLDFTKDAEINIEELKQELPELPQGKRNRFSDEYGFKSSDAKILTSNPDLADYTENVISELKRWLDDTSEIQGTGDEIWNEHQHKLTKLVAGWLISKLGGLLTARKLSYRDNTISAENFAEFITMLFTNKVSTKNANLLLERMLETGGDPSNILEDEDLVAGDLDLEKLIDEIINKNPEQVQQFKAGKTALLKFFLGKVMKESQGKANPQETENLLIQKLSD
ncbi:Asp-tRNA(Asn)/Glu-tRNA(Gln) amidotransferase subunit GatB [Patescibacteria group bacterium]|nr:Asp-tRNA(Asn)/Glu-tRNA(Gln) amidotransferase subunit GatB [Patescibacteria group bacterium]